jgi:hypothetical protein
LLSSAADASRHACRWWPYAAVPLSLHSCCGLGRQLAAMPLFRLLRQLRDLLAAQLLAAAYVAGCSLLPPTKLGWLVGSGLAPLPRLSLLLLRPWPSAGSPCRSSARCCSRGIRLLPSCSLPPSRPASSSLCQPFSGTHTAGLTLGNTGFMEPLHSHKTPSQPRRTQSGSAVGRWCQFPTLLRAPVTV